MGEASLIPDLAAVDERLFTSAKRWFTAGLTSRYAAVGVGLLTIVSDLAPSVPFVVGLFAIAAEGCVIRSDIMKGRADRLLRIRELQDGFGWLPDVTAVADILATVPEQFETAIVGEPSNQFASQSVASPKRAFENLRESAWWTQQLALSMFKLMAAIVTLLLIGSLAFLIIATLSVVSNQSRVTVARVVAALISLISSAGLAKLTLAYYFLFEGSRNTVRRIQASRDSDELVRRIGVLYDYQNVRTVGPLIPNTLYKFKRARLNRLWALQSES